MLKGILSLYGWRYPTSLVALLQQQDFNAQKYLSVYWHTNDFDEATRQHIFRATPPVKFAISLIRLGILLEIAAGLAVLALWHWDDLPGGLAFGLALIVGYPVVWGHMAVVFAWLAPLAHPRRLAKRALCYILEQQVKRLRKHRHFKVVAVVGSVGKTSTKAAIASTLQESRRVIWQEGNYNDRLTVPLVLFGHQLPGLTNVWAWTKIWFSNQRQLSKKYPYDIAVLELGTDTPGDIAHFSYLQPDLLVVTAVTPEHMEYFGTLDAVATEELSAIGFSKQTLANIDDIPAEYLQDITYESYGLGTKATYYADKRHLKGLDGQEMTLHLGKKHKFTASVPVLGEPGAKIAVATAAVGHLMGLTNDEIENGLQTIKPFSGRMQLLSGLHGATLIDDTYNATPVAVKAALDVLYAAKAKQRIAILGSMNELGDYAPEAHREVGDYCDPKKLDLLITIGNDARTFLAPLAEAKGCKVKNFNSPYAAGKFAKKQLKEGAVVLAKGSQNGVFAEEALKFLLAKSEDAEKLVRQNAFWMAQKRQQFKDAS